MWTFFYLLTSVFGCRATRFFLLSFESSFLLLNSYRCARCNANTNFQIWFQYWIQKTSNIVNQNSTWTLAVLYEYELWVGCTTRPATRSLLMIARCAAEIVFLKSQSWSSFLLSTCFALRWYLRRVSSGLVSGDIYLLLVSRLSFHHFQIFSAFVFSVVGLAGRPVVLA